MLTWAFDFHPVLKKRFCAAGALISAFAWCCCAQDDAVQQYINTIKSGPAIYRTPEAVEYYSRGASANASAAGQDRDAAIASLRAAVKLGEMGPRAKDALGTLVDRFPQLEHVVAKRGVHFTTGNGTFEDWVQTYLVSEKSNFVFSSPFVEYATLSKCENWIEAMPNTSMLYQKQGSGGRIVDAIADIFIILRINAGACALASITGTDLGSSRDAWQRWWNANGGGNPAYAPSPAYPAPASAQQPSVNEIAVGGKYSMHLVTGDDFTGIVTAKDDSSLTLKTETGLPYNFRTVLIEKFESIALPLSADQPKTDAAPAPSGAGGLSSEDILQQSLVGKMVEIRIKNGSIFKGTLASINGETARINVEGSEIPITRALITKMSLIQK